MIVNNRYRRGILVVTTAVLQSLGLTEYSGGWCGAFSQSAWPSENFRSSLVAPAEFLSGGVAKDAIPALTNPRFFSAGKVSPIYPHLEPVIAFEYKGTARAYPLGVLMWHEIVNDQVAGLPISVTYCPLCNASVVYERRVGGQVFDFGVSGLLRNSDLVMYDRQTQSFWQQFTGKCLSGVKIGSQLKSLSSRVVSLEKFIEEYPKGEILSHETGFNYNYNANSYRGYDSTVGRPFLYKGVLDERLPPLDRVLGVKWANLARAYPYKELERRFVINDSFADYPIVLFAQAHTLSVLDQPIVSNSRLVVAPQVFSARLMGKVLTFYYADEKIFDKESGSVWNSSGHCLKGFYIGKRLELVSAIPSFAFAWLAFYPQSDIWRGDRQ